MTKDERATWIAQALERAGIALYGRASRISKDLGCAKAASTGWLNGSLPRDLELAFRFADFYEIDLREWVTGEKSIAARGQSIENMRHAIKLVRQFEYETEIQWDSSDFTAQVEKVLADPVYMNRHMADVIELRKTDSPRETQRDQHKET